MCCFDPLGLWSGLVSFFLAMCVSVKIKSLNLCSEGKVKGGQKRRRSQQDDLCIDVWELTMKGQLTSKRRVGITEFKGVYMVNIREYYEKDGETLPGKKVRVGHGKVLGFDLI